MALLATIIISIVLLAMIADEGFAGWHARFTVLGTEQKEQANALAEGCADQALASAIADPSYKGSVLSTFPGGTCFVSPINMTSEGKALIKVKSEVASMGGLESIFSNLAVEMNLANIHLGEVSGSDGYGIVVVQTLVQNNKNTSAQPSNFTMHVQSGGTLIGDFPGTSAGQTVQISPGSFSINEDLPSGFAISGSPGCSGVVAAGEVKTCTFLNTAVSTTLTLIANVVNDNAGEKAPADFGFLMNAASVGFGETKDVTPGDYTLSLDNNTMDGYLSSVDWSCTPQVSASGNGAGGVVHIASGDNKVCVVKIDDIAPPNPSCSDTVMMLDRTGSMSSTGANSELSWLKNAANTLTDLYSQVTVNSPSLPTPKLGVGSFGGITNSASTTALVPYGNTNGDGTSVKGFLSVVYNDIRTAITAMMDGANTIGRSGTCVGGGGKDTCTDISAAISKASDELSSANHDPTKQKVLILISDGVPSLPLGSALVGTGVTSPSSDLPNSATDKWNSASNAYSASDGALVASTTAGTSARHQFTNFQLSSISADATINGIEVDADAWSTPATGGGGATASTTFSSSDSFAQWGVNSGSIATALAANDGDTTYLSDTSSVLTHTFNPTNASGTQVPTGSTLTAVTLYVVAKADTAGTLLYPVVEKDSTHVVVGPAWNLTTSYATYSYAFGTTGDSKAWTQAEVINWTNDFGVRANVASGVPRVTQMYVKVQYQ